MATFSAHSASPPPPSRTPEGRLSRPGVGFDARVGAGAEDARLRVDGDGRIRTQRPCAYRLQFVPLGQERRLDRARDAGLDGEVSGAAHVVREYRRRETARGPARGLDRLLDVHAEI